MLVFIVSSRMGRLHGSSPLATKKENTDQSTARKTSQKETSIRKLLLRMRHKREVRTYFGGMFPFFPVVSQVLLTSPTLRGHYLGLTIGRQRVVCALLRIIFSEGFYPQKIQPSPERLTTTTETLALLINTPERVFARFLCDFFTGTLAAPNAAETYPLYSSIFLRMQIALVRAAFPQ